MDTQTITQTINIVYGDLSTTGSNTTTIYTTVGITILTALILFLITHKSSPWSSHPKLPKFSKLSTTDSISRNLTKLFILPLLTLATISLSLNIPTTSATPALTLNSNQDNLTITIPQGGGQATTTTTLTTGSTNTTGYTLTTNLEQQEPGINIAIQGGDITTNTPLTPNNPLTLKTTAQANTPTTNDTTDITLTFTIDSTVTPGKKQLKLSYSTTDNTANNDEEVLGATTLQDFTTAECSSLPTYTGSNEEAVITLTDTRGDNQQYQIAKLADNNCWMLNNLKLGSATSTLTLTPQDTNIATNFTLPQLYSGDSDTYSSNDEPFTYQIPLALRITSGWSSSASGTWSLDITSPITATVGPFAYDVDGNTVASALQSAVGETVTTTRSGRLDGEGTTAFSWYSLNNTWSISIDTSSLVQDNGPGLTSASITDSSDYGYLYNWSAATAGESTTSHTQNDGDAPYSICPANWRLPKSGVIDTQDFVPSPTNEFNTLSAMMAGFPNGQDPTYLSNLWEYQSNWLANGPFKGSLAGVWGEGFVDQGGNGYLWSSSAFPGGADYAFFAVFNSDYVGPTYFDGRGYGLGVRCLLNQ